MTTVVVLRYGHDFEGFTSVTLSMLSTYNISNINDALTHALKKINAMR